MNDEFPIGGRLDSGVWEITEVLYGSADRGLFRARRTDGHETGTALVTLAPPQKLDYPELHRNLAMTGTGVAALRYVGPLEAQGGRYDGLVEDEPAGRPLRGRAPSPRQAADLIIALCEVVDDVGAYGWVLRGIRPELVYTDDAFGLTGVAPRCEPFLYTASPACSGTPHCFDLLYSAPEVLKLRAPTPAADVFSLAAILAEVTGGEHPFAGDDPITQLHSITGGERRRWRGPAVLRAVIDAGLDADPGSRPEPLALADQLRGLRGKL